MPVKRAASSFTEILPAASANPETPCLSSIGTSRYVFCFVAVIGAIGGLDLVWTIADNLNAMMAVPNLVALPGLHRIGVRESKNYVGRIIRGEGRGGRTRRACGEGSRG